MIRGICVALACVGLATACVSRTQGANPLIAPVEPVASTMAPTPAMREPGSGISATTPIPLPSATTQAAAPDRTPTAPIAGATLERTPVEHVDAIALGGIAVRSVPSMTDGTTVRTLADREPVVILREVRGERWVVGDQTWAMAIQDWSNLWYLVDGGYVYAGFVFIPRTGELDSLADRTGAHWVDVDLVTQTARAMIGDRSVHAAEVTTGKPGFETPAGEHTVAGWGRRFNETMTSAQAGIQSPAEQYNVRNVLYTQYFDGDGDALHLNYWQPESVFGRQRTSHGCVGLRLHDAQYLWLFLGGGGRVLIHPVRPATPVPASRTAVPTASPARPFAPATLAATSMPAAPSTRPATTTAAASTPVASTRPQVRTATPAATP